MTRNGSVHGASVALSLLGLSIGSCTLELTGTGSTLLPQTAASEAGVQQHAETPDAEAQQQDGEGAQTCTRTELALAPRAPDVLILLDHSSSMFEFGHWEPVKRSVLEAVERFEREIRFGLVTYTGQRDGECPTLQLSAELALNNAAGLRGAYQRLEAPTFKGETPTAAALSSARQMLAQDPGPGGNFIFLVTDGDPDFCDDGPPACARDAVVAAAQAAHALGVTTFVFGVGNLVATEHLADVANAGSGQPVAARDRAYEACPESGARYAETGGAAQFHEAVAAEPAPSSALSSAIASTRSCVFDMQDAAQHDLSAALALSVEIDGQPLARDAPDGFRIDGPAQLELLGAACQRWRTPDAHVSFALSCAPEP